MIFAKNRRGFSLLEVLIVVAILAVVALIASRAIKGALQNKKKMEARLRVESSVYDALRLMSSDVEKAFHYQYALYEIDRQAVAGQGQPPQPGQPAPIANPATQIPPPERLTHFIGKEGQMHFTSTNHLRSTANAQESNQEEVGYYLSDCNSRLTGESSRCLWRRSSPIIDNDVTRGGQATPLVENVSVLKFEYLSEDMNDKEWKSSWLSDANGSGLTQNMFPKMVKITLEVQDKNSKDFGKFGQTVIATVRFTNNIDPAKKFSTGPTQATPPPPGIGN